MNDYQYNKFYTDERKSKEKRSQSAALSPTKESRIKKAASVRQLSPKSRTKDRFDVTLSPIEKDQSTLDLLKANEKSFNFQHSPKKKDGGIRVFSKLDHRPHSTKLRLYKTNCLTNGIATDNAF